MLLIVGTESCSKCSMTKEILNAKGVEYEYQLLSSMPNEEQEAMLDLARKNHQMSMPLIIKDGQLITLQEV